MTWSRPMRQAGKFSLRSSDNERMSQSITFQWTRRGHWFTHLASLCANGAWTKTLSVCKELGMFQPQRKGD